MLNATRLFKTLIYTRKLHLPELSWIQIKLRIHADCKRFRFLTTHLQFIKMDKNCKFRKTVHLYLLNFKGIAWENDVKIN